MKSTARFCALLLALIMLMGMTTALAEEKPDTWIADRNVQVQIYVNDAGYTLPVDQFATMFNEELKARTGMTLEFLYTPGDSDQSVLASQLAVGMLPDMIMGYLNNSSRPEFPIYKKAADEGMFVDLAPLFANTEILKNYAVEGWASEDCYSNIMFRDEWDGACYMGMRVTTETGTEDFEWEWNTHRGGMWIQTKIVEEMDIDPKAIKTQDDLYNLLVAISEKGYTDLNGNPIVPLGPGYWGGDEDDVYAICNNYYWGMSDEFNVTEDGQVLHESETEYAMEIVNYFRKLMAENLIHQEFFTMDMTRAEELYQNMGAAIIADAHSGTKAVYNNNNWTYLGPTDTYKGEDAYISHSTYTYGAWAIPETTENPQEIVDLLDYLCSEEGYLLCKYGVEGVTYTMEDGQPMPTQEIVDLINAGDVDTLRNKYGFYFDGSGCYSVEYIRVIALDEEAHFNGKSIFTEKFEGEEALKASEYGAWASKTSEDCAPEVIHNLGGLDISGYMITYDDNLYVNYNMLNYKETLIQAMYASSDEEAANVISKFVDQLHAIGIEDFYTYIEEMYAATPEVVYHY